MNESKSVSNMSNQPTNSKQSWFTVRFGLAPFILLSVLLLVYGFAALFIEQRLSYVTASFLLVGGLSFIVCLYGALKRSVHVKAHNDNHQQSVNIRNPKRWKTLGIIASMIIASIAFIAITNYSASSSKLRWDVTQNKQHTLSQNTIEFISGLSQNVKLTAFYVGTPPTYLQDLLNEYERNALGNISVEIIDPIERIAYAAKFGNAINGEERKVIIESGTNRKDIDFTQNPLSEENLTNAIASASRPIRKAYFLGGHGEYDIDNEEYVGLSKFKQRLANNNIQSELLMLGISQRIPEDADVLIIAGPKTALTSDEEELIADYLDKGGDALFLIEHTLVTTPDKPLTDGQLKKNPSLNTLLNPWGMNVESDVVVDLTNHVGGDVGSPATKNYQPHKAITEGLDYTFYVRPRSIRVLDNKRPSINHAVIAYTASSENSWGETDRTLDVKFDPNIDTPGPVPISYVALEQRKDIPTNTSKTSDTRLIVFTDADFLTNVYLDQYSNAQMGLNVVNWLAELDAKPYQTQKNIEVKRVDLTSKQKRQIIVILFLLPFAVAMVRGWIWLRRPDE